MLSVDVIRVCENSLKFIGGRCTVCHHGGTEQLLRQVKG